MTAQVARSTAYLGEALAHLGKMDEAHASLAEALATPELGNNRSWLGECWALSAHLHAMTGDLAQARTDISRCEAVPPFELYSQTAWSLTAAYALSGDKPAADRYAELGAHAFVEDALRMIPELVDTYARISWNRNLIDYLSDRDVSLHLSASR
jgi:tetratricopeptide (TPR) repeat protein